jgi:hypothetical protein
MRLAFGKRVQRNFGETFAWALPNMQAGLHWAEAIALRSDSDQQQQIRLQKINLLEGVQGAYHLQEFV